MKIEFTHDFIKIFKKRFSSKSNIQMKFNERMKKFAENPDNPILLDHSLSGKLQGHRAFSVTGDIRVVYYIFEDIAYFIDIDTHNQVYGK
ncbi:MAG: type II toxin-antitoxin system mRNA interferase toxin, RelE/StbE family [Candidatus Daviesbacteria bacterium]|nr:type II toxin-antitoxin system mRNA interferase toxin, RelE/StbE family [Candidatus Daviesbacteria bacterium]